VDLLMSGARPSPFSLIHRVHFGRITGTCSRRYDEYEHDNGKANGNSDPAAAARRGAANYRREIVRGINSKIFQYWLPE